MSLHPAKRDTECVRDTLALHFVGLRAIPESRILINRYVAHRRTVFSQSTFCGAPLISQKSLPAGYNSPKWHYSNLFVLRLSIPLMMFGVSTFCLLREPLREALDLLSGITDLIEVVDEGPHLLHDLNSWRVIRQILSFMHPSTG